MPSSKAAAEGELKGVLEYSTKSPIVSVRPEPQPGVERSSMPRLTKVVNGVTLVKALSWYDNEWGFSNRMLDTTVALMNAK